MRITRTNMHTPKHFDTIHSQKEVIGPECTEMSPILLIEPIKVSTFIPVIILPYNPSTALID